MPSNFTASLPCPQLIRVHLWMCTGYQGRNWLVKRENLTCRASLINSWRKLSLIKLDGILWTLVCMSRFITRVILILFKQNSSYLLIHWNFMCINSLVEIPTSTVAWKSSPGRNERFGPGSKLTLSTIWLSTSSLERQPYPRLHAAVKYWWPSLLISLLREFQMDM